MDLDSLASVVLWAIILVLLFGLQPWKTMNGMRNAMEHRPDRYSASLHIIDMDDGMHFGDRVPTTAGKGTAMQSGAQATKLDDKRIEHVRALRRAAIRRRRLLVGSLFAVAVVVFVLALLLHFSPLFALIPIALDGVVLALGVRASKQAREWEHKVAAAKRRASKRGPTASAGSAQRSRGRNAVQTVAEPETQTATDAMSAQDIQAALERAKAEKLAALKARELERRAREAAARAQASAVMPEDEEPADSAPSAPAMITPRSQRHQDTGEAPKAVRQDARGPRHPGAAVADGIVPSAQQASAKSTASPSANQHTANQPHKPVVKEKPASEPEDFTNELERVSPSHALDAFELASNQDLISFSLGAPRHGKPVKAAEPQSLEIKSTKQVAHAEPVKPAQEPVQKAATTDGDAQHAQDKAEPRTDAQKAVREADAASVTDSVATSATSKDDAVSKLVNGKKIEEAAARRAERKAAVAAHAPVVAPAKTEESLGVNVDAVLARRRG